MEIALQRSRFASKHIWQLVAAEPPWSKPVAIGYVFTSMHSFIQLWLTRPTSPSDPACFRLSVDHEEKLKEKARSALIKLEDRKKRHHNGGAPVDTRAGLKDDLYGEADKRHPLAELLELPECGGSNVIG